MCGATAAEDGVFAIQRAHVLWAKHDPRRPNGQRYVLPHATVALCARNDGEGCHQRYDRTDLNLLPHLTAAEVQTATDRLGEGPAMRRMLGPAWREGTTTP